jgi:basic amino acid/polyamine antiporter, APA family
MANTKASQIGLTLTVAIGFASMLGAGVFTVFHDAAVITTPFSDRWALLIAIALAGLVASLNATSVYHLARKVSRAGGVYAYSREYVNDTTSFIAGFSFVFGKVGSISAIALVCGIYVWPSQPVLVAVLAIALLTAINLLGINRTAQVALVLSIMTITFLAATVIWGFAHPAFGQGLQGHAAEPGAEHELDIPAGSAPVVEAFGQEHPHDWSSVMAFVNNGGILAILTAASVVFFAFAGYARVATLGEEVRDARRNIPRAIFISLTGVLVLYFALAVMFQQTLGTRLVHAAAPFKTFWHLSTNLPAGLTETLVAVVAAAASLGSILALLAGVSRTAATMAEDNELLPVFARRNRLGAPWVAEVLIAVGSIGFALLGRVDWSIGFSSLSVLLYYAIGHIAALKQLATQGASSRLAHVARAGVAWLGLALCAALLVAVPGPAVWLSTIVLAAAIVVRRIARKTRG